MKLEDQVCSFESAKRLKELGVKQDSIWYWLYNNEENSYIGSPLQMISDEFLCDLTWDAINGITHKVYTYKDYNHDIYSAFTASELGRLLKKYDGDKKIIWKRNRLDYHKESIYKRPVNENEAEARANMLIYLLENKIIKVEDLV